MSERPPRRSDPELELLASTLDALAADEKSTRQLAEEIEDDGSGDRAERDLLAIMSRAPRRHAPRFGWLLAIAATLIAFVGLRMLQSGSDGDGPRGVVLGERLRIVQPSSGPLARLRTIEWNSVTEPGATFTVRVRAMRASLDDPPLAERSRLTGSSVDFSTETNEDWPAQIIIEVDRIGPDGNLVDRDSVEVRLSSP